MWWNHDNLGVVGWLVMMLGMASFWILVAIVVVYAVRGSSRRGELGPTSQPNPRSILDERLARGEIDLAEYDARLAALARTHDEAASHRSR